MHRIRNFNTVRANQTRCVLSVLAGAPVPAFPPNDEDLSLGTLGDRGKLYGPWRDRATLV
jgi:hypothetical protein